MKKPSLKTIAAEVGVSVSTVSRVLNNDATCYVSSLKRDAIMEAIRRHKYTPNLNARNLLQGKTSNVAFVTRKFDHFQRSGPFLLTSIDGIQEELQKFGYSCSLVTIDSPNDTRRLINKMSLYDGIIFGRAVLDDETFGILEEREKPTVFMDESNLSGRNISCVRINKEAGIGELEKHLRLSGCRRVALYGVSEYAGLFRDACDGAGFSIGEMDIFHFAQHNTYSLMLDAYEHAGELLKKLSSYDAVCCTNDFVAYGLCKRLEANRIIPGKDIAVSGFDNIDEILDIPAKQRFLTTVDNPRKTMGRECAKLLLRWIDGGETAKNTLLEIDSKLVVRSSTANFKA